MSHYMRSKVSFHSLHGLVESLRELGFILEIHDSPQHLYGYHGDVRPETANVIIRRAEIGASSNDVGFLQKEDGSYEAIISQFDSHRFDKKWKGHVAQLAGHAGGAGDDAPPLDHAAAQAGPDDRRDRRPPR